MIKIGNKEVLSTEIANTILDVVKNNPQSKLLLPTGNSPVEIYNKVSELYKTEQVSFKDVVTFNLDEYLEIDVEANADSFRNFMNNNLFNKIDIDKANTHFPTTPSEYDAKLDEANSFDFGMIGVGTNGHIAFNEPPADYAVRTNEVKLAPSTIKDNFGDSEDHPTTAITMGLIDIIEKPKFLVLIAWGESKRPALEALKKAEKTGEVDPNWPITYLIKAKSLVVYTDIEV